MYRSQIATIGVAAASNVVGVIVGGILGHSICTGAAVLGGKHLATHIDERMVAVLGGALFLVFGVCRVMLCDVAIAATSRLTRVSRVCFSGAQFDCRTAGRGLERSEIQGPSLCDKFHRVSASIECYRDAG
jgi:hypothetical protein